MRARFIGCCLKTPRFQYMRPAFERRLFAPGDPRSRRRKGPLPPRNPRRPLSVACGGADRCEQIAVIRDDGESWLSCMAFPGIPCPPIADACIAAFHRHPPATSRLLLSIQPHPLTPAGESIFRTRRVTQRAVTPGRQENRISPHQPQPPGPLVFSIAIVVCASFVRL